MKTLAQRVKLIRHKSAASVAARCYRLATKVFLQGEVDDLPASEAVAAIERNGFWGFARTGQLEIHFWTSGKVSRSTMAMFFGHELGHIYDFRAKQLRKRPKGFPAYEWRADAYGEVAEQAMLWAEKYAR